MNKTGKKIQQRHVAGASKSKWESVDIAPHAEVWIDRLPVPGGWLYICTDKNANVDGLVFVPRPKR